jgi:hypothetical protein
VESTDDLRSTWTEVEQIAFKDNVNRLVRNLEVAAGSDQEFFRTRIRARR